MQPQKLHPLPRVVVWAALAVFALYSGIRLATGPGRDLAFDRLTWTGATLAQVLGLTALLAGIFARASYVTYRREIADARGALRFPGARVTLFGEVFLTLVGGVLLLAATFMVLHVPEALLASNDPTYAHYASASPTMNLVLGGFFGSMGFLLMILRRYVWEARPGQPMRRYWARAFGRGRVVTAPLTLYWSLFHVKRGYQRIPVGHWLRGADPTSEGFFRDADLAIVPLDTPPHQLAAIEETWRGRLWQHAASVPAPAPRAVIAPATDARASY